jgi:hypothetical protein
MNVGPTVFVFACGRSGYVGLSLMKDGANLPPCAMPPHAWKRVDQVPMKSHELALRNVNPKTAIEALISRGWFVNQPSADVVAFSKNRKPKERH